MFNPSSPTSPLPSCDFVSTFRAMVTSEAMAQALAQEGPRGSVAPKLSIADFYMCEAYHLMAGPGSMADHVQTLTGVTISNSALSQRKETLGCDLLQALLPKVLKPLAAEAQHPEAFYAGWRLVAIDGTQFSLRNTSDALAHTTKAAATGTQGEAAFAKINTAVLVELGTHNPLTAVCCWQGTVELTLARSCLEAVPPGSLLLADRLYGCGDFLAEALDTLAPGGSQFLVRVKANLIAKIEKALPDGSAIVSVKTTGPEKGGPPRILRLREIRGKVKSATGEPGAAEVRLWTTLLDERKHPAKQLMKLYAGRWEQELFFKELKTHLHGMNSLLRAQRIAAGVQEIMALILAAAVVARQRMKVADGAGVSPLRVSLQKVQCAIQQITLGLEALEGIASAEVKIGFVNNIMKKLERTAIIPPRRARSCARGVRQPVSKWPRINSRRTSL